MCQGTGYEIDTVLALKELSLSWQFRQLSRNNNNKNKCNNKNAWDAMG